MAVREALSFLPTRSPDQDSSLDTYGKKVHKQSNRETGRDGTDEYMHV